MLREVSGAGERMRAGRGGTHALGSVFASGDDRLSAQDRERLPGLLLSGLDDDSVDQVLALALVAEFEQPVPVVLDAATALCILPGEQAVHRRAVGAHSALAQQVVAFAPAGLHGVDQFALAFDRFVQQVGIPGGQRLVFVPQGLEQLLAQGDLALDAGGEVVQQSVPAHVCPRQKPRLCSMDSNASIFSATRAGLIS